MLALRLLAALWTRIRLWMVMAARNRAKRMEAAAATALAGLVGAAVAFGAAYALARVLTPGGASRKEHASATR